MSKVDTDQGLGPGSERHRQEVREAQKELESGVKQKPTEPKAPDSGRVDRNAITEPGVGKVERKSDTVDDLLDGFGTSRPDLPRILPKADTTPPPEPVKKELTPTSPGARQRARNKILVAAVSFAVVIAIGIALVKLGQSTAQPAPPPTQTATTTIAPTATQTAQVTETVAPITTMAIDSLPVVKTVATPPGRSVHSATTATAPTATTAVPHPTGSAPPGLNLFPDDPHR